MKTLLLLGVLCLLQPDFHDAVLLLSGASCLEELDESELERYQRLASFPLDLNLASRSRLLSCGLFSPYQVASLMEYRSANGDILSFSELSLVDGFNETISDALTHFVRLSSASAPGQRETERISQKLMIRASVKQTEGEPFKLAYGTKYSIAIGERLQANWSSRTSYSEPSFGLGTLSAAYYGRRALGKVVLGDFNARFGQGLLLWSGFSMSLYSSVSSFRRNGVGISPSSSFSSTMCGVASDWDIGKWTLTAAWAYPKLPIVNATRISRNSCVGLTACTEGASLDWRFGVPSFSFYGEAALKYKNASLSPAAVCGFVWIPAYGNKASAVSRWNLGRWENALGFENAWLGLIAYSQHRPGNDYEQYRAVLHLHPVYGEGKLKLSPSFRAVSRWIAGQPWRNELRAGLGFEHGSFRWNNRLDLVRCESLSWLAMSEIAWVSDLSVWLRGTLFRVDKWNDRIYVYERDAPGSFSVPAYYGRGWSASVYASWKPSRRHAFYARASIVNYPWMQVHKSSVLELKLQYALSL